MKDKKCYLLDIDGTVCLGDRLIDGAKEFIDSVRSNGDQVLFMTNNSSKSSSAYEKKLQKLGLDVKSTDVFTSGDATIHLLKEKKNGANVYLLGNQFLQKDFEDAGFNIVTNKEQEIDFVVLGFDTTLTYDKIWTACDYIRDGVPYYATHPDYNCPLDNNKWMPDTGAMIEMIYASTGVKPYVVGKPNSLVVDIIVSKFGYTRDQLYMVGDRLYTDMLLGVNANIKNILVLTGETNLEQYNNQSEIEVYKVVESIKDLMDFYIKS